MPDETQKERHAPHVLTTLAGVLIAFLLLAAIYVVYQAAHILFPQNVYETALPAVISDTVEADGVLLFDESYVAGSGNLGYLAADGERVSAGTAVAEVYSNASQASLRLQLNQLNDQIDLLQKSQNTSALQLDTLLKERSSALYDLLDTLDDSDYEAVDDDANAYLLAQNKLWVVTGEAANFTDQITALVQQSQSVQAQLGSPAQITAPQTGYFVRSSSSGRLNASADDILALNAQELQGYLQSDPVLALDGCAGKIVAGFTWRYVGVCTAKQGEKLLGQNGKPLSTAVEISFPGQVENSLKATVTEVEIDQDSGLRVPAAAVHYLKEDGTEAQTQGENYIPGVYVKLGNIARFCPIDPVDADHPLITDGDYILVLPEGTEGSVSKVRLYDEIIVSGQNLYDGKLL